MLHASAQNMLLNTVRALCSCPWRTFPASYHSPYCFSALRSFFFCLSYLSLSVSMCPHLRKIFCVCEQSLPLFGCIPAKHEIFVSRSWPERSEFNRHACKRVRLYIHTISVINNTFSGLVLMEKKSSNSRDSRVRAWSLVYFTVQVLSGQSVVNACSSIGISTHGFGLSRAVQSGDDAFSSCTWRCFDKTKRKAFFSSSPCLPLSSTSSTSLFFASVPSLRQK